MNQKQLFYVRTTPSGKIQGPFTSDQLKRLAAEGKLKREHTVSRNQAQWVPAEKVKELFPHAAAEPTNRTETKQAASASAMSQKQLHEAIDAGDIEKVRALLESDPAILNSKHDGALPIHTALNMKAGKNANYLAFAELVLPEDAKINERNAQGMTALHLNSMTGDKSMAKALIDKGADINARNPNDGSTPLHLAALQGKDDLVAFLIDHGADKDAKDKKYGITALHFAGVQGHTSTLKLLLSKGADMWVEDNNGRTPLALSQEQNRPESVRILTQHMEGGVSQAQEELDQQLFAAVEKDDPAKIRSLLEKGANHGAKNNNGNTALHEAAFKEHLDCCKALVAGGANPQAKNDAGQTPLQYAEDFMNRHTAAMGAAFGGMMGGMSADFSKEKLQKLRTALQPEGKAGCFIATACCDSPNSIEVQRLCRFRDTQLRTTSTGQALTGLYYKLSPPLAEWLARRPLCRRVLRTLLIRPLSRLVGPDGARDES